jgi:hypothetical protein
MADPTLQRCLLACRLAYGIQPAGQLLGIANQELIGLIPPVQTFLTGPDSIDAALFGIAADAMFLAFRGTIIVNSPDPLTRIIDWLNDADALLIRGANLPGLVHQGFRDALDALWPALQPVLAAALADPAHANKPLYVTGHSKGGALANLAAARIAATLVPQPPPFDSRVQCITFAAARPGDQAFATAFDTLVPHAIRCEYQNDVVPHAPPGALLAAGLNALPDLSATANALFVSAGTLSYYDWNNTLRVESTELEIARIGHLLLCLAEKGFTAIAAAHSIDGPTDTGPASGYSLAFAGGI